MLGAWVSQVLSISVKTQRKRKQASKEKESKEAERITRKEERKERKGREGGRKEGRKEGRKWLFAFAVISVIPMGRWASIYNRKHASVSTRGYSWSITLILNYVPTFYPAAAEMLCAR